MVSFHRQSLALSYDLLSLLILLTTSIPHQPQMTLLIISSNIWWTILMHTCQHPNPPSPLIVLVSTIFLVSLSSSFIVFLLSLFVLLWFWDFIFHWFIIVLCVTEHSHGLNSDSELVNHLKSIIKVSRFLFLYFLVMKLFWRLIIAFSYLWWCVI